MFYYKKLCSSVEIQRLIAQPRVCNAILDALECPSPAAAAASGQ